MIKHFDYKQEDYPLHIWLVQFVAFGYTLYRLFSRDYSVYGFIPDHFFSYPRYITNLYPPKTLVEIINFHWIYNFVEYLDVGSIESLQLILIIASLFGLLGIYPKVAAIFVFFGYLHLVGYVQSTNSEIDGGSLCFAALLVVALSNSHYHLFKKNHFEKSIENRWPIYLLFLIVGVFYTSAGVNKIIDIGPDWAFKLHLDFGRLLCKKDLFFSSRLVTTQLIPLLAVIISAFFQVL